LIGEDDVVDAAAIMFASLHLFKLKI